MSHARHATQATKQVQPTKHNVLAYTQPGCGEHGSRIRGCSADGSIDYLDSDKMDQALYCHGALKIPLFWLVMCPCFRSNEQSHMGRVSPFGFYIVTRMTVRSVNILTPTPFTRVD